MILSIPEIIKKKREGLELRTEEINFLINSVTDGRAADSQIGAMLMAIFLKGLNLSETVDLTKAIINSGETLKFDPSWINLLVDKHSTGGVGDKISLILAPALAANGFKVPMVSGRGLEFTGGTLDKLESIPGFKVQLTSEEMNSCLKSAGCFIAGATASLAPADGILYKHRDVTCTVDSMPLITSSILSKKAAEGISALVMDLKYGRGAFIKTREDAIKLGNMMRKVADGLGLKIKIALSPMDVPLGRCVGNALEVFESIECLKNKGSDEIKKVVSTLGAVILHSKGLVQSLKEGIPKMEETLRNGIALKKFEEMIIAQGVDQKTAEELCRGNPWNVLPKSERTTKLRANESGFVADINALDIAVSCWHLGAGRSKAGEEIDYSVGIKLLKLVGEEIKENEEWIEVHHKEFKLKEEIEILIQKSLVISSEKLKDFNKSTVILDS